MRLGISTASFFNRISTESCFDMLRQMRVDSTEVFLNTFSEYEKKFIEVLVPRKVGISVESVHALGTQFEPELFSTNARVRADAEIIFRKVCYAGYMLGAKFYTFHGPVKLKKLSESYNYIRIGDRVNQLVEIAQTYGIRLSYENVHWAYGSSPEYFKELIKMCPKLYTTLDIKQAVQAGEEPIKFLDAMQGRISTIHLCDVQKDGMTTALPGNGKYNFEKFFIELNKRGIKANIFIEAYANDYKDINELKSSYDTMNALLIRTHV